MDQYATEIQKNPESNPDPYMSRRDVRLDTGCNLFLLKVRIFTYEKYEEK